MKSLFYTNNDVPLYLNRLKKQFLSFIDIGM